MQSVNLPESFDGFTILHISDLHADISVGAMRHLLDLVGDLEYDICVLTGDYRGKTYGPFDKSLEYIDALCARLKPPVYGILGNHDSIRMAPAMEAMGIRMLFNECEIDRARRSGDLSRRHRRRAFLSRRRHRQGCRANSARCLLDPAVAHAGNPTGRRPPPASISC